MTATAPLGITTATGNATCTTCVTSSASLTANGVVYGSAGTQASASTAAGAADTIFMGNDAGTGSAPAFKAGPSGGTNGCAGSADTTTYNTSTHAWGCHQISSSGTVTSSGSPASGNIPKFTTATNIAPAAASDVIALFSACSGTQYLGADGACHIASGAGTVTTVSAPPQFATANPTTTPAITYPALPNNYTEDPNTPALQNFGIRHNIWWTHSGGGNSINSWGDTAVLSGTFAYAAPTATLPESGQVSIANGSVVGAAGTNPGMRTGRANGMRVACMIYIGTSLTNVRTGCGVVNSAGYGISAAQPAKVYAEVVFDQSGAMGGTNGGTPDSTHWLVCTGTDGTHQSCASTGVTVAAGTTYKLEVFEDIANSKWTGFVNGAGTDEAANNPASGTNMCEFAGAWGTGTVTGTFNFSFMQATSDW